MKQYIFSPLICGVVILSIGCGDKSDDAAAAAPTCPSAAPSTEGGYVLCVGSATTATFDLKGGAGEQYVVSPFTLGDHASVAGATAASFNFAVTATSASLQQLRLKRDSLELNLKQDSRNLERLIANRFDIRRGENQEPWIWQALDEIDSQNLARGYKRSSLKRHFQGLAKGGLTNLPTFKLSSLRTNMTLANCPSTAPTADGSSTITIGSSFDGTSFCIGYETAPTGDTKENVQTSIKNVLTSYKDTIYQDQMTSNTKGGYAFNPLIVFVSGLSYEGAFSQTATTVGKRPVIHIKASLSKAVLHATIAHEMQHAIVDYYKQRGSSAIAETVSVDEAVAHLMEDAFGYGEANFQSYVKNFLIGFVDGAAVLSNDDDANAAAARGGAYSLVYSMAVRAGGFTVTNGKPFSGPGMNAIVSLVKQTEKNGPAALASAFGQPNLVWRVGQLIGGLFNDNRSLSFAPAEFLSTTYSEITDILGATGLKFGLRYNNFREYETVSANTLSDGASIDVSYYQSSPITVIPSGTTSTVTVTLPPASTNNGITVARIK